jgi:hypothetical protein
LIDVRVNVVRVVVVVACGGSRVGAGVRVADAAAARERGTLSSLTAKIALHAMMPEVEEVVVSVVVCQRRGARAGTGRSGRERRSAADGAAAAQQEPSSLSIASSE